MDWLREKSQSWVEREDVAPATITTFYVGRPQHPRGFIELIVSDKRSIGDHAGLRAVQISVGRRC